MERGRHAGKAQKARAAERGLRQVLLREGRKQSRTRSVKISCSADARPWDWAPERARRGASEFLKMKPDEYLMDPLHL